MPTVLLKHHEKFSSHTVSQGEILWDELDGCGIQLPSGCLAGSCGICRIEVLEKPENLSPKGNVEKETIAHLEKRYQEKYGSDFLKDRTIRLSCRARIQGDLCIRPLEEEI
jgi:ferredoxin